MRTFFVADHHFWHHNILTFKSKAGTLIRDGFEDIDDMHDFIIEQHNKVVAPDDKVYFLGDVVMRNTAKWFKILEGMNGTKILIKGNHDNAKLSIYQQHFKDVRATHLLKAVVTKKINFKVILSHIPIHPESLGKNFNIHGHIHDKEIQDERYINVSLEQLPYYKPVEWEEIMNYIRSVC